MAQVETTHIPNIGNEKAQKTLVGAVVQEKEHHFSFAIEEFRKADKQDGGGCLPCKEHIVTIGMETGDYKAAMAAEEELLREASTPAQQAHAHYLRGVILLRQGVQEHKDKYFPESESEFQQSLTLAPGETGSLYGEGLVLAHMKQDDAAKTRFEAFVQNPHANAVDRQRAARFAIRPELVRARMAPAFSVTTLSGQHISLDELGGKVVLLDFWATWCGPCREALPGVRRLAQKYSEQPLVVLSISLDSDEGRWKDFVAKNGMTWPQYRDGGFGGRLSQLFAVNAIPHTFTIDADGVLQEEHVGDANLEGKIKKLLAQAQRVNTTETASAGAQ